jgi:hypothetical protein
VARPVARFIATRSANEQILRIAQRVLDQDVPPPGDVGTRMISALLRLVRLRSRLLHAALLIDRHAGDPTRERPSVSTIRQRLPDQPRHIRRIAGVRFVEVRNGELRRLGPRRGVELECGR